MDTEAWSKLESSLVARKVPRSLWPRYFEKEIYRELRRRISDDEEYRRRVARKLQDDHNERQRRDAFASFVLLLAWLISEQDRQRMDCRSFLRFSVSVLADTEHSRMLSCGTCSNAATCSALLVFGETEVREAMADAIPGGMRQQLNSLDGLDLASIEPQSLEEMEQQQRVEAAAEAAAEQDQDEPDPDVMAPDF